MLATLAQRRSYESVVLEMRPVFAVFGERELLGRELTQAGGTIAMIDSPLAADAAAFSVYPGGALNATGASRLLANGSYLFPAQFTVSYWGAGASTGRHPVSVRQAGADGWQLEEASVSGDRRPQIVIATSAGLRYHRVGSVPLGQMTFVTFSYDGTDTAGVQGYLNGEASNISWHSGTALGPLVASGQPCRIGQRNVANWSPYDGPLDRVLFFNRVLTPDEIRHLYLAGINGAR